MCLIFVPCAFRPITCWALNISWKISSETSFRQNKRTSKRKVVWMEVVVTQLLLTFFSVQISVVVCKFAFFRVHCVLHKGAYRYYQRIYIYIYSRVRSQSGSNLASPTLETISWEENQGCPEPATDVEALCRPRQRRRKTVQAAQR